MSKDDTEKRMQRLREAKLEAERERDLCLEQLKSSHVERLAGTIKLKSVRYRLRLARMALHAKRDTVRKKAYFLATRTIRLKKRYGETIARIKQLTKDNDQLQDAIDRLKMAAGPHKCPQCKQLREFDNFPKEPRFVLGRDLSKCKSCDSKRVRQLQVKRLHRQQHGEEE